MVVHQVLQVFDIIKDQAGVSHYPLIRNTCVYFLPPLPLLFNLAFFEKSPSFAFISLNASSPGARMTGTAAVNIFSSPSSYKKERRC
jgi:hypothetical protein